MNSSLEFLQSQKKLLIIVAIIIFSLSLMTQITLQHFANLEQINQESTKFTQAIYKEIYKKHHTLETLSNLLDQAESKVVYSTLEALTADQHAIGLVAIGHAIKIPNTQIIKLQKTMFNQGYESFRVTPFTSSMQPLGNTSIVINKVLPFTPLVQTFLGQDISTIARFDHKFKELLQTNFPQPILFLDDNRPYLLSFYAKVTPDNLGQPHASLHYFFYITDIAKTISQLAKQSYSIPPLSILLRVNSVKYLKLPTSQPIEHTFTLKQKVQFDINDSTIFLTLSMPIHWSDFNLIALLFWSVFTSLLFFTIFLTLLFTQRYFEEIKIEQRRQQELLQNSHQAIIITSDKGKISHWNSMAVKLFGYRKTKAIEQKIQALIFDSVHTESNLLVDDFQNLDFSAQWTTQLAKQNKALIDCKISISKLEVKDKIEIAFYIEDISEKKRHENKIHQLAYYDALTGLENRTYFSQHVEKTLQLKPIKDSSLLFIDLDGFKRVNDSLGHTTGDKLLKIIAQRFSHSTRSRDQQTHLCRFGGDEFIFYLHDISFENTIKTALRILKQVEEIIHIGEHEIQISASIGIALAPTHGTTLDTLLRYADTAMYQAKVQGKNTYAIYDTDMEENLSRRLLIEKHLRTAIQNHEFSLVYQPQIQSETLSVIGVEALLRWNSAKLGFIPPDQFIQIAEDSGQILKIGDWVIQEAISQLKLWQNTPYKNLRIAINISPQQLGQENFGSQISQLLTAVKVPAKLLEIELTERSAMSNADKNINIFKSFREKDLSLAIDDFGTGYSSLSYLKRFPINVLKIDKSFIDGLPFDEEDASICNAIIQMAHSLNMFVVAEGVETAEQLHFLKNLNCDLIQGYYFSPPLPVNDLEKWILEHNKKLAQQQPTTL